MMKRRSYIRRYGRMLARRDGGWYCHYCHIAISRKPNLPYQVRKATVDHVVAIANGGCEEEDTSNMVLCCDICNQRKGTMAYASFMNVTRYLRLKRPRRLRK